MTRLSSHRAHWGSTLNCCRVSTVSSPLYRIVSRGSLCSSDFYPWATRTSPLHSIWRKELWKDGVCLELQEKHYPGSFNLDKCMRHHSVWVLHVCDVLKASWTSRCASDAKLSFSVRNSRYTTTSHDIFSAPSSCSWQFGYLKVLSSVLERTDRELCNKPWFLSNGKEVRCGQLVCRKDWREHWGTEALTSEKLICSYSAKSSKTTKIQNYQARN